MSNSLFTADGMSAEQARALVARMTKQGLVTPQVNPPDIDELCREKIRERDRLKMREIRARRKRSSAELHGEALARLQREWAEAGKVEGSRLKAEGRVV